jgi:adenylate kinase family enzyme
LFGWLRKEHIRVGSMIVFHADESTLMSRLLGRRMHNETGEIHHVTSSLLGEGQARVNEESFTRREDDRDEAEIEKRMRSFKRFMPQVRKTLLRFFKGLFPRSSPFVWVRVAKRKEENDLTLTLFAAGSDMQLYEVDAGRSQEEIYAELIQIIGNQTAQIPTMSSPSPTTARTTKGIFRTRHSPHRHA